MASPTTQESGPRVTTVATDTQVRESNTVVVADRETVRTSRQTQPKAPPRESQPHSIFAIVRHSLAGFAVLCLCLALFLFAGTALSHNRSQADLQRAFRNEAAAFQLPPQFVHNPDGSLGTAKPIAVGSPVAWMRIANIGVSEVVVEGSTSSQTMRGPGHVRSTPLPGQYGNSVVICRRATGGAPCADINTLRKGQEIHFSTAFGDVAYRVFATGAAKANDARIFNTLTTGTGPASYNINTLTLVTSDPAIVASDRYVVQAELIGSAKNFTPSKFQVRADELGLSGESNAWFPLLLSLQLLLAITVGAVILYKRWKPHATWLIATPLLVVAMWLVFEQFARLLPGAL